MNQDTADAANSKAEYDPKRARALAEWAAFKNPLVWGAYTAQVLGFVLVSFVFFPTFQPRLALVLAYAIPTVFLVRKLHERVAQQILEARTTGKGPA
jgi:hypothetical protein